MAETLDVPQETIVQEAQPSIQELAAFAFNKPFEAPAAEGDPAATPPPVQESAAAVIAPATDYLKDLGFADFEAAKAEIESLRQLKAQPQTAAQQAFANEQSQKIYNHLLKGDIDPVYNYLDAQKKLSNVDAMDTDQQLRLFYKMQNPLYDDEILELKLQKEYGFNESDYKDEEGVVTDHVGYRLAKADAAFKKQNDLQKAKDFFVQYKQKIELPDIQPPQQNVDKDYEAYKASNASADQFYNTVAPQIKSLKESDVSLGFTVNDANNKMQFDIAIIPDAADFEAARQDSLSMDLMKSCYDKDGKFIPQNLQRLALIANNFDKYGQAIARQAVNAERKRVIEQETAGNGLQRNYQTNTEPSEMDALKAFAFQKTG